MVSPNRNCQNASFPKNTESTMPVDTVWNESLCEQTVTYHIEIDGQLLLIENVPARVNVETVERLQQAAWGQCRPVRTIQTPVYEYAALP